MTMQRVPPLGVVSLLCGLAIGCGGGPPDADSLRTAFAEQIMSVSTVGNFDRDGDQLTFTGPGASGGEAAWLVRIDSAVVEPHEDQSVPYRGLITSSWYADGQLIEPVGTMSGLPSAFLDIGIAQDCWGLWDPTEGRWTW